MASGIVKQEMEKLEKMRRPRDGLTPFATRIIALSSRENQTARRRDEGGAVAVCVVCLALAAVSGCGTFGNLGGGNPKVYGGVREMAPMGWSFCFHNDSTPKHPDPSLGGLEFCIGTYFLLIDTPLSAVGDTVTLPYILYLRNHRDDARRRTKARQRMRSRRRRFSTCRTCEQTAP